MTAANGVAETEGDLLQYLREESTPPTPSQLRKLDLPDGIWAAIDEGAECLVHDSLGPTVWRAGTLLWPNESERAGLLAEIKARLAKQEGKSTRLEWKASPARAGFYWFYGWRPQDARSLPAALQVVVAEEMIEVDASTGNKRPLLLITSDGIALRPDATRGLFAPILAPPAAALPRGQLSHLPEPPPPDPRNVVHCVYGGHALCGAAPEAYAGRPVARFSTLAAVTCPSCRTAAGSPTTSAPSDLSTVATDPEGSMNQLLAEG